MLIDNVCMLIEQNMYHHVLHAVLNKSSSSAINHSSHSHRLHPYPAEFIYLNFHPLEVVSRFGDPQL